MSSIVYFLERPSNRLVKIGRSAHFRSRYLNLCREYGERLEILGVVDEDTFAEADLHRLFKDMRYHNEWFVMNRHIRWFLKKYAVPYDEREHGGTLNHAHLVVDRELGYLIKRRAEREGLTVQDLLDRLLRDQVSSSGS